MVLAPRVAAASDGSAWLAWTEGSSGSEALIAARVDASGRLSRSQVSPPVEGAVRDVQIMITGSTPIIAWREYAPDGIRVRVATHPAQTWENEFADDAWINGGVQLILLKDGSSSLVWQRAAATMGPSELVSSLRSPRGQWSAPVVVATAPAGVLMGAPRHAALDDGSLRVAWSEELFASNRDAGPQSLMTSRYDAATKTWEAALPADAVNGPLYGPYDIAAAGQTEWMLAWATGSPGGGHPSLLSKRSTGTGWEASPTRVDTGEDDNIRELTLLAADSSTLLAWTGTDQLISPSSLRAATFNIDRQAWSLPALIAGYGKGYPDLPRVAGTRAGAAVAVWNVPNGEVGGPLLASTGPAGAWRTPSLLDAPKLGLAPDISLFSADDFVATWYRYADQGRIDIVIRRGALSGL